MVDVRKIKDIVSYLLVNYRRRIENISVTDITGCLRQTYYDIVYGRNLLEPEQIHTLISAMEGGVVHSLLGELLQNCQELNCILEQHICVEKNGLKICGRPDAICLIGNELVILEFKTVRRRVTVENIPRLYMRYIRQVQYYMCIWNMLNEKKIEKGYIVFIQLVDKASNPFVYEVKHSEDACREMFERAEKLWKCLQSDIVPEPEPSPICSGCYWRSKCMNVLPLFTTERGRE